MKNWENFKTKHLGKISKFASWTISIAGLVFAILSFFNQTDLGGIIVLLLIVLNSVFLILVSIYETVLYRRGSAIEEKIYNEKNQEIIELETALKLSKDLSDKLRYYYKYIILTLNKFITQLSAVNIKYVEAEDSIKVLIEEYKNSGKKIDEKLESYLNERKVINEIEYRRSMLKEYNHFLGNTTNKLKYILDNSLKEKGCSLETSISIKQFSRIVTDVKKINDVIIITTFRDNQTYSQGKREVGNKKYSIDNNTDFIYCLTHTYFLKNNISLDDRTYANEHQGFQEYYNCTVVVPIKYEYPDCSHLYGYLTCDILNDDLSKNNLLDDNMAEIMEATANIIGAYFDSMDYQWEYTLEDDFLDIIYKMKSN